MATPLRLSVYEQALELARKQTRQKHPGGGLIERGSTHRAAVRAIQQRLSDLGYEVSTDGIFGNETEQALREFQGSRDAKIDGIVGKETLGKLTRAHRAKSNPADVGLDAVERVVGSGQAVTSTGATGRALGNTIAAQKGGGRGTRSKGRGKASGGSKTGPHGGTIDKATGAETATAKTGPIGSTKVPTPRTFGTISGGGPNAAAASSTQPQDNNPEFNDVHPRGAGGLFAAKGSSGQEVSNLQTALNQTHDEAQLKVDGQFGDKTDSALRGYQQKVGLTVDGIAGPKTAASLRRRLKLVKTANSSLADRPT